MGSLCGPSKPQLFSSELVTTCRVGGDVYFPFTNIIHFTFPSNMICNQRGENSVNSYVGLILTVIVTVCNSTVFFNQGTPPQNPEEIPYAPIVRPMESKYPPHPKKNTGPDYGIPRTQMGPLVLIGSSALFWRVDLQKYRSVGF